MVLLPKGAVGVVIKAPSDATHSYRIRLVDGRELSLHRQEFAVRKDFQRSQAGDTDAALEQHLPDWRPYIIYRCVIGSRAYGLAHADSDTDRRGIYLPPADLHWSLYGVPEQLENEETQEGYWELQKFLMLALKANPNVLECLYTPLVEHATPLAEELLAMRAMLPLAAGLPDVQRLRDVPVQEDAGRPPQPGRGEVEARDAPDPAAALGHHAAARGLSSRSSRRAPRATAGDQARRDAVGGGRSWRLELHEEFDEAFEQTSLPERPDYERANEFLIKARRSSGRRRCTHDRQISNGTLQQQVDGHPYPLLFATISGAHLYGFPSPDSDYDLRGVHVLPLEQVVGLDDRRGDHREVRQNEDGLEIDLVTHDVKKFFGLMLKKNGYVLEQLFSPLVVHTTPEHEELKAIAPDCITRHHATTTSASPTRSGSCSRRRTRRRVKPLLYVYRVLLTGIHLMRTGEVEANLVHSERGVPASVHPGPDRAEGPIRRTLGGCPSTSPSTRRSTRDFARFWNWMIRTDLPEAATTR